jgi:dihydrofolate reductase
MIRFIAAIDSKLGLANDQGIPWQGRLPTDIAYFRKKTIGSTLLMGYGTYKELTKPFPGRINVVASSKKLSLLPGFKLTNDARKFLSEASSDAWVIGGSGLFMTTLDLADELYLTRIKGDFGCSKFFPEFTARFEIESSSKKITENGISFHYEVWCKPNKKLGYKSAVRTSLKN